MRNFTAFLFTALAGLSLAAPAPYPLTVNSRAQTAPPVIAYRGNESTFRVSFVDGSTASDLTGVVPFMAWATNASATVNSTSTYAVVGSATNGVVDFTFSPASVNYTPYRYMYEVGVKSTSGIPRVYRQGTFTIAGSPIGGGASAFVGTTNVSWAAFNWIGFPSYLLVSDTNGWETGSHAGLATTGSVDSIFGDMLAHLKDYAETNRVTRWYDPELPSLWAEWDGTTNIIVYAVSVTGTNLTVTLSADFMAEDGTRPAWTNSAWPFDDGVWRGVEFEMSGDPWYSLQKIGTTSSWDAYPSSPIHFPLVLSTYAPASGTATVAEHYAYATNVEHRYYLPTNAIPPELANLDLLQAWLNNIYATTNALAAVSGALGTHTNDAPAHVSASDRSAWYGVTNLPSAGCTALALTGATNLVVTGATYSYTADVTNAYWLSIAGTAPAYHYSLTVYGTNSCTLADNMRLIGVKTETGTNCVAFKPWTNGLWEVMWGGK